MTDKIVIKVEKSTGLILNYDEIEYVVRRAITGRYRTIYGIKGDDGTWTNYLNPNSKQVLKDNVVIEYLKDHTTTSKKVVASAKPSLEDLSKDELIAILRKLIE